MSATVTLTFPGSDRTTEVPGGLYIDGRWTSTSARLEVVDPATGDVIAEVADATDEDGLRALDAAVAVQPAWADVAPRVRGDLMHALHGALADRAEAIADVMTLESGQAAGRIAWRGIPDAGLRSLVRRAGRPCPRHLLPRLAWRLPNHYNYPSGGPDAVDHALELPGAAAVP